MLYLEQYDGPSEEGDKDGNEIESIEEQATGTSYSEAHPIDNHPTTEVVLSFIFLLLFWLMTEL